MAALTSSLVNAFEAISELRGLFTARELCSHCVHVNNTPPPRRARRTCPAPPRCPRPPRSRPWPCGAGPSTSSGQSSSPALPPSRYFLPALERDHQPGVLKPFVGEFGGSVGVFGDLA